MGLAAIDQRKLVPAEQMGMGSKIGRRTKNLAYDILGKPYPAARIDVDANAYVMERRAGQVNAVPACWRLIYHALLYCVDTVPRSWIWAREANVLAAVCKLKAFVGDANTLIYAIRASVAESTMNHIPTMQPCPGCERTVPDKWIETSDSTVMINQGE